jgi:HSP20 family protein
MTMAFLTLRQSPADELFDFRRDFDSIFDRLLAARPGVRERFGSSTPPIQAWVDAGQKMYRLRVALPGVDPDKVQISAQGNMLTISGEQEETQEAEQADYLQREFSFERFERSVTLPEGVEVGKLNAEYKNGMVEITAPLSDTALPRRIEIKSSEKGKAARA